MRDTNFFKADLRELKFVMYEQFKMNRLFENPYYEDWNEESCNLVLEEANKYCNNIAGPTFGLVEEDPPAFNAGDNTVKINPLFKEAYEKGVKESGWQSMIIPTQYGGDGAPYTLTMAVYEMLCAASPALSMFLGGPGVIANLIGEHGTPEQKKRWNPKLVTGEWNGTMVLTESDAGSDVGAIRCKAVKQDDGSYLISGNKIFISNGEHDVNENIIHMVLARIEGDKPGTKGLSLFIVPKMKVGEDGEMTGEANDVICGSIEHKMGLHGSPTCTLYFGENGGCQGYLLGEGTEGKGIKQMFTLLNEARIMTGHMANAQAAASYYNALAFARERIQGVELSLVRNPDAKSVPIIKHADVRRMLMEMKSLTEACRALVVKLCMHVDLSAALHESDPEEAAVHERKVDLLTPLVKAFLSDQSWRICELAIQVHGGYGYIVDYPVEQYARNVKILSIYEGTNHIQSLDFVGRKMPMNNGADFQNLVKEIKDFCEQNKEHPALADEVSRLADMTDTVNGSLAIMFNWLNPDKFVQLPANANKILEMVSLVVCAWLILDAAVVSAKAVSGLSESDPDYYFYEGKIASARYFCRQILPVAGIRASSLALEDMSFISLKDESFSTAW